MREPVSGHWLDAIIRFAARVRTPEERRCGDS
jgi:hypothetical protein